VLELAGIRDVLAKSLGTTNPINMLKAAETALRQLRRPEDVARARGKSIRDVLPQGARIEPEAEPEPDVEPAVETEPASEEVVASGESEADAGS
jgi:Ribosomal protein S5, C-terminal domain